MFPHILNPNQKKLLPVIQEFKHDYYLVGGTAIALQIGHRQSIDFDLFTEIPIAKNSIKKVLYTHKLPYQVIFEDGDQLHFIVNDTKLTFYEYPYPISHALVFDTIISMPSLIDLASMKAFALGKRAKWRDYVDLYFLLRHHLELPQLITRSQELYQGMFNDKLFIEQLTYYKDIDYSQPIHFIENPVSDETIRNYLTDLAIKFL